MSQPVVKKQQEDLQSAQSEIARALQRIQRAGLKERDQLIYHFHTEKGVTLEEIAQVLGKTRERIRQIVNQYRASIGGVK